MNVRAIPPPSVPRLFADFTSLLVIDSIEFEIIVIPPLSGEWLPVIMAILWVR